jgi:hypothetical protein
MKRNRERVEIHVKIMEMDIKKNAGLKGTCSKKQSELKKKRIGNIVMKL